MPCRVTVGPLKWWPLQSEGVRWRFTFILESQRNGGCNYVSFDIINLCGLSEIVFCLGKGMTRKLLASYHCRRNWEHERVYAFYIYIWVTITKLKISMTSDVFNIFYLDMLQTSIPCMESLRHSSTTPLNFRIWFYIKKSGIKKD